MQPFITISSSMKWAFSKWNIMSSSHCIKKELYKSIMENTKARQSVRFKTTLNLDSLPHFQNACPLSRPEDVWTLESLARSRTVIRVKRVLQFFQQANNSEIDERIKPKLSFTVCILRSHRHRLCIYSRLYKDLFLMIYTSLFHIVSDRCITNLLRRHQPQPWRTETRNACRQSCSCDVQQTNTVH